MNFNDQKEMEMTTDEKIQVISNLKKNLEENFVQLGQLLSEIKRAKVFRYKGYDSFKEFIEAEFNISGTLANKIIGNYELFLIELDVDEKSVKQIGLDKLNIIKPLVRNSPYREVEEWINKAEELPTTKLREEVKEVREKKRSKEKTLKDIYIEQYLEKMIDYFNCGRKELDYKLALYFQEMDLDEVKKIIKSNERKLEETD
ncbi:MAG TPA: hypothetical protein ENL20_10395 [Candidatus Cloacimonetes bacterium]|nr:hypothetical protein [Candidatus Cloacimonadota bacterium]